MLPLLFSFLGGGLAKAGVLGAAGSFLANPLVASAIGSGIGTLAETGDPKKALLGGLGSFAGGQLLGGIMGGAGGAGEAAKALQAPLAGQSVVGQGAGAMTTGTPLFAQPGMSGAALMPPAAAPQGGLAGMLGGRAGDVVSAGAEFAKSGAGMGSALGGMLPAMMPDRARGGGGGEAGPFVPSRAMQREAQSPGPGFMPGVSGEFGYGVSDPYTAEYMQRYAPQRRAMGGLIQNPYADRYAVQRAMQTQPLQSAEAPMRLAGGGMVERMVPGYGPVRMQAGGIADAAAMQGAPAAQPNEREIISAAVAAIKGQHPQPEMALGAFLQAFGEQALRDLVDRVMSGEMDDTAERSEGQMTGPGDGMSDMIPASIDGQQDVLLSDGEYVVPADVVSGLGNGSSDAGARALDQMAERVRQARTGTAEQAPAIPQDRMMPV